MKTIKQYLLEELFATPMNTIGAGGIIAPTPETLGSGDIPMQSKKHKKHKKRVV